MENNTAQYSDDTLRAVLSSMDNIYGSNPVDVTDSQRIEMRNSMISYGFTLPEISARNEFDDALVILRDDIMISLGLA